MLLQRRPANPDLNLPDSIHPLLRQVYSHRALQSAEELQLGMENLIAPDKFKAMDTAVELLHEALEQQQRILIVSFPTNHIVCEIQPHPLSGSGKLFNYVRNLPRAL